jgi:hypothetical protein
MRDAGPPPERAFVCALVRTVAAAETPAARLTAIMLLHDVVTLGRWTLAFGADGPPETLPQRMPMLAGAHEDERRLLVLAGARPDVAVTTALAARFLALPDAHDLSVRERARAWLDAGDVPLAVLPSIFEVSARSERASPRP